MGKKLKHHPPKNKILIVENSMEENKKLIETALEKFDFEKTRKVMEALNWTFYQGRVPCVFELKHFVRSLLTTIIESDNTFDTLYYHGFCVQFNKLESCITIKFVVEENKIYGLQQRF